jgi:hypothetical protein
MPEERVLHIEQGEDVVGDNATSREPLPPPFNIAQVSRWGWADDGSTIWIRLRDEWNREAGITMSLDVAEALEQACASAAAGCRKRREQLARGAHSTTP